MKSIFLLFTVSLILLLSSCSKDSDNTGDNISTGGFEWAKQAGGTLTDYGHVVLTDGQGNIYISGCFTGTANFGSFTLTSDKDNNLFIAKMDASGEFRWAKKCGGNSIFTDQERLNSMALDLEGNLYVCGTFSDTSYFDAITLNTTNNNIFIAKLNSKGDFVWATQAGGPGNGDFAFTIAVDNLGGVFLAGTFYQVAWFGDIQLTGAAPGAYSYLARMSNTGQFSWAKMVGESTVVGIRSVTADSQGDVYFTGFFNSSTSIGPYPVNALNNHSDIYVAKISNAGIYDWVKTAQGPDWDVAEAISVDNQQNVYITGTFQNSIPFGTNVLTTSGTDAFFAKMNPSGDWIWAKQGKTVKTIPENSSVGYGICADDEGNVFATGYYMGKAVFSGDTLNSNGHTSAFFIRFDAQGNYKWVNHADSRGGSIGSSIVPDKLGNCYATGFYSNPIAFGDYSLPWSGGVDVFIAKLKDAGN